MKPSVRAFPSDDDDLVGDVGLCSAALGDQLCAELLEYRLKARWPRVRVVERTELAEMGRDKPMLYRLAGVRDPNVRGDVAGPPATDTLEGGAAGGGIDGALWSAVIALAFVGALGFLLLRSRVGCSAR